MATFQVQFRSFTFSLGFHVRRAVIEGWIANIARTLTQLAAAALDVNALGVLWALARDVSLLATHKTAGESERRAALRGRRLAVMHAVLGTAAVVTQRLARLPRTLAFVLFASTPAPAERRQSVPS